MQFLRLEMSLNVVDWVRRQRVEQIQTQYLRFIVLLLLLLLTVSKPMTIIIIIIIITVPQTLAVSSELDDPKLIHLLWQLSRAGLKCLDCSSP